MRDDGRHSRIYHAKFRPRLSRPTVHLRAGLQRAPSGKGRQRRTIRDSFQTCLIAFSIIIFAFALTFVEDFAVLTKRPQWLIVGIEALSVLLFIADALVIFAV